MAKISLMNKILLALCLITSPLQLTASNWNRATQNNRSTQHQINVSRSIDNHKATAASKGGCHAPEQGPPGTAIYGFFCTYASFNPTPEHLGAYVIDFHKPVLFNQNNGEDFAPPAPLSDISTNATAVTDPSGTDFVGYTDIIINISGDYLVTWQATPKDTGTQMALAKVNPGGSPEILEIIPCTRFDSGAGNQTFGGTSILSLEAGDILWLVNDDSLEDMIELDSGSRQTGTVTTAFVTIHSLGLAKKKTN